MQKTYIAVVDTEVIGLANRSIYDLGVCIMDKKGNIVEQGSWLIQEIFDNERLFATAYFANKRNLYFQKLEEGKIEKVPFLVARQRLLEMIGRWNVKYLSAYNLGFDLSAFKYSMKAFTGSDHFFPLEMDSISRLDIWGFACETILQQKTFQKMAVAKGWISDKGNKISNAEICFRYITGNDNFVEEHTGLEDCKIECQILARCFAQHKSFTKGWIKAHPWRLIQKKEIA